MSGDEPAGVAKKKVYDPLSGPARFIPFRRQAIVELICRHLELSERQRERFRTLAQLIAAFYHYQFHHKLEVLKDAYFPFNPDLDVRIVRDFSPEQLAAHNACMIEVLLEVLDAANFEPVPRARIEAAFSEESMLSVKLGIDFDDFVECHVYGRGSVVKTREIRRWWLFRETVSVPTFERVVLVLRFKEWSYFRGQRRTRLNFEPGSTLIKMFKDMPHADLEMLFPNTQLQMRVLDKLLLGVPAIGGAIPILLTKVLPQLPLIISVVFGALSGESFTEGATAQGVIQGLVALGAFGGYCYRQWDKFKNRRIQYLKQLTESLYFKNLDNNAGVFHRLIDAAEEEEVKEAILAYAFLVVEGPRTAEDLDARVEAWFREVARAVLDFEVDGALEKLERLGIAKVVDGRFEVLGIDEALKVIDGRWDAFFDFEDAPLEAQLEDAPDLVEARGEAESAAEAREGEVEAAPRADG